MNRERHRDQGCREEVVERPVHTRRDWAAAQEAEQIVHGVLSRWLVLTKRTACSGGSKTRRRSRDRRRLIEAHACGEWTSADVIRPGTEEEREVDALSEPRPAGAATRRAKSRQGELRSGERDRIDAMGSSRSAEAGTPPRR